SPAAVICAAVGISPERSLASPAGGFSCAAVGAAAVAGAAVVVELAGSACCAAAGVTRQSAASSISEGIDESRWAETSQARRTGTSHLDKPIILPNSGLWEQESSCS